MRPLRQELRLPLLLASPPALKGHRDEMEVRWDLHFGHSVQFFAVLFEAMETKPLRCQALNTLLDVDIGEDVAELSRVHPPADFADVTRLLLRRRRNKPLHVRCH